MIDIRQSVQYTDYLKRESWIVERREEINYFIRKFPLIGSILKLQRPEKIDFSTINKLCRKYRVFQVIIEPNLSFHNSLYSNDFRLSKSPYLPSKTLQIDLTQAEEKIYTNFTKDCKYNIRKGEKIKVKEYSTPNDIKKWREAWRSAVKFNRYVPSAMQLINLRKSFTDGNSIFLASHNIVGSIMGGALFTKTSHGVAYYWYGFTNSEGRSSLSQYSLLYNGILWAKKSGCKVFDFEGVYDSRFPNKSWLGFTHFKHSFGGSEVFYPGCYTKLRFPFCKTVKIHSPFGKTCDPNT
jgi:lipid II:glycine glycyltransferase (peptidoglycan interpeptide bridge formation enzyme)